MCRAFGHDWTVHSPKFQSCDRCFACRADKDALDEIGESYEEVMTTVRNEIAADEAEANGGEDV
jgi:glutaredoxin